MLQKKKIILLAALILIVILVGIGVFLAVNNSPKKTEGTPTESTNSVKQDEQNALLDVTFTDTSEGVSLRLPKGWQLTPKNEEDPRSLTKFQYAQSQANGELLAQKSSSSMDDVVRGYLEAALNISISSKLINNKTVTVGDKVGRLVSHEVPGPDNQTARITEYIFNKNGTYYILAFTMLIEDWEAQQPGIEASAASLQIK